MTLSVLDAIKQRTSANNFDATATISDAEIKDLVSYAIEAPSSFNIQHWKFIAVTDKATKEKLKALSWNQQKVADAAVTFVIFGDLEAYKHLAKAVKPLVDKGVLDQAAADGWVGMANNFYGSNPQAQRDEVVRSVSLAAMNLMLAAQAKGYVSGAMIGFDPEGVRKELGAPENWVPAMMLPVGPAAQGNWPRKPRYSVDDVLSFNKV